MSYTVFLKIKASTNDIMTLIKPRSDWRAEFGAETHVNTYALAALLHAPQHLGILDGYAGRGNLVRCILTALTRVWTVHVNSLAHLEHQRTCISKMA